MKQVVLATLNIDGTYKVLPPATAPDGLDGARPGGAPLQWLAVHHLYLSAALPRSTAALGQPDDRPLAAGRILRRTIHGAGPGLPLPCRIPARQRHEPNHQRRAELFAVGNYVSNYLVFGNPAGASDAVCVQGHTKLVAGIPDGQSNTIFFGEAYGTCSFAGNLSAGIPPPRSGPIRRRSGGRSCARETPGFAARCAHGRSGLCAVQHVSGATVNAPDLRSEPAQSGHSCGMNCALG